MARDDFSGETFHSLARQHDMSRNMVSIWIQTLDRDLFEFGEGQESPPGTGAEDAKWIGGMSPSCEASALQQRQEHQAADACSARASARNSLPSRPAG